jgi:hypothetical protein
MRKFLLISIALVYLYVMYLAITMFMIPAFQTYFTMYGVFGTFAIWAALTIAGWACGYFAGKIIIGSPTFRENFDA